MHIDINEAVEAVLTDTVMRVRSPRWLPIVTWTPLQFSTSLTSCLALISSQQIFVYLKKPKEETAMPTFEVLTEYKIHIHSSISKSTVNIPP